MHHHTSSWHGDMPILAHNEIIIIRTEERGQKSRTREPTSGTNHEKTILISSNRCSSRSMAASPGSNFQFAVSSYKHTRIAQFVTIATTPRFCYHIFTLYKAHSQIRNYTKYATTRSHWEHIKSASIALCWNYSPLWYWAFGDHPN